MGKGFKNASKTQLLMGDGVTSHTSRIALNFLHEIFQDYNFTHTSSGAHLQASMATLQAQIFKLMWQATQTHHSSEKESRNGATPLMRLFLRRVVANLAGHLEAEEKLDSGHIE
jgi:hypothetical protein